MQGFSLSATKYPPIHKITGTRLSQEWIEILLQITASQVASASLGAVLLTPHTGSLLENILSANYPSSLPLWQSCSLLADRDGGGESR